MSDVPSKLQRILAAPRVASITAYDYVSARLADEAGVDLILVGDSLGMVVAGYENTTLVTMEQMVYHTEIAARAVRQALLASDLPYRSYATPPQAIHNAKRLVQAGAEAVKLEGGKAVLSQIQAIIAEGIPVVGHLGMLPQSILEEKGYHKKGKTATEASLLQEDALLLQETGVSAIVLECVVPSVAAAITSALSIPTIGIGSGPSCRGEIAVFHDVIGAFPWFHPPFAVPHAQVASEISRAVREYAQQARRIMPAR
jgi:3-methyl-2-oxobutanoate hydroxymethyltransferase